MMSHLYSACAPFRSSSIFSAWVVRWSQQHYANMQRKLFKAVDEPTGAMRESTVLAYRRGVPTVGRGNEKEKDE